MIYRYVGRNSGTPRIAPDGNSPTYGAIRLRLLRPCPWSLCREDDKLQFMADLVDSALLLTLRRCVRQKISAN